MRWLRSQSIRARITISSFVIAVLLLTAAAVGFRLGVNSIVAASTRTLLNSDASPYEKAIHQGHTTSFNSPGEGQLVAVVDPSGTIRLSNLPDSLEDKLKRTLIHLEPTPTHIVTHISSHYDVINESVTGSKGVWHIVAARSRASSMVVEQTLTLFLAIGTAALAFAFALASWIVSGLALRPVRRMRERARDLSSSARHGLLPVGPVQDELASLAVTLNDFITSLRASADRERQMVADASHELRTPIAVLTTQLQLAHLSAGDADALEREISAAQESLARLSALSTSLLTLSRIDSAEGESPADSSVAALEDELLASMDRARVLGASVGVGVDFTVELDATPAGGRSPIAGQDFAQLVDNLVANAIAASSAGDSVEVELRSEASGLSLVVTDSGHGIPESFIPVAFDRFSRADSSRRRSSGGSGLGLAIVKAIVVRSGGSVTLERRPSGGVRAAVALPWGV